MGESQETSGAVAPPLPRYAFNRDPEILSRLLHDARASLSTLAQDMGDDAYRQKAWRRLKALEESTIWGYTAIIDEASVGWTEYIVLGKLNGATVSDRDALRKSMQALTRDENIRVQSLQVTAEADLQWIGRAAARSALAIQRAVQEMVAAAPHAFDGEPRIIPVVGKISEGGKLNPDEKFRDHLLDQWFN